MLKLRLKLFANFRELIGESELAIELDGRDISDLLDHLCRYYDLRCSIYNGNEIREDVNISVNGLLIGSIEGIETELSDGDEVAIFPPVSGG